MPPSAAAAKASSPPTTRPLGATLPPVQLTAFEGPLDLLLHLVRAGRMDIFDLPILQLCDQYLAFLHQTETWDLNITGEFLVMAATLLEIKSRLLLPALPKSDTNEEMDEGGGTNADEDPRAELVRRLLEYGKFQAVAETLKQAEQDRRLVFFRAPTMYGGAYAVPPRFGELSAEQLLKTLERMLANAGAGERAVTSVRRQKITLRMKMREVLIASERAGLDGVLLQDLLPPVPFERLQVVLLFLALLELLKNGGVLVAQEAFCGEIRVFFVPEAQRDRIIEAGEAVGEDEVRYVA